MFLYLVHWIGILKPILTSANSARELEFLNEYRQLQVFFNLYFISLSNEVIMEVLVLNVFHQHLTGSPCVNKWFHEAEFC